MQTGLIADNVTFTVIALALLAIVGAILDRLIHWVVGAIGRMSLDDTGQFMGPERTEQIRAQIQYGLRLIIGIIGVGAIAIAAYLTFTGINFMERFFEFVSGISVQYLTDLGMATAKMIAAVILLRLVGWLGRLVVEWLVQRLKAAQIVRVDDERVHATGKHLLSVIRAGLWYVGAVVGAELFWLTDWATHAIALVFEIIVVYCLVRLLANALAASVDSIYEGVIHRWKEKNDPLYESRGHIANLTTRIKSALCWAVYIIALLYVASQVTFGTFKIGDQTLDRIMYDLSVIAAHVIAIWIGAMVVVEVAALVIDRVSRRTDDDALAAKRRQTVTPLLSSVLRYAIYFIAGVMTLNVFNVDTTAILAGAGVAGVAIGFGAQHLIKDVVTGFFILFEGYYWVGDWIETGEGSGIVESITIRTTWVRDRDGMVHIIPNGQITALTSYSREFCKSVVEVGVAYEGDLERAVEITEDVMGDFAEHEPDVTGEPEIHVMAFNASDIGLRIRVPVLPKRHVAVGSKIRRLIKRAYDEAGVEIPFSRHVVQFEQADGTQVDELPVRLVHDTPEQ